MKLKSNHLYPQDLVNGVFTLPSRPRTYLQEPEKGLLPHSCSLTVWDNDLYRCLFLTSHDLRGGSGVKLVLDKFENRKPLNFNWRFYLDPEHPDFNKITKYQAQYLHEDATDDIHWEWITVEDSMVEMGMYRVSIEESWKKFIELAEQGKDIVVDLSSLRPSGQVNSKGLTATGAVGDGTDESNDSSFFAIYDRLAKYLQTGDIMTFLQLMGTLNATLRRGGQYKNGIITSSMISSNPLIRDYLNADITKIAGSHKKAIRLLPEDANNIELLKLAADKRNSESLFLEKVAASAPGTYQNVCLGIELPNRGTCLIGRVNLGLVADPDNLWKAFCEATEHLCHLHINWRSEVGRRADIYQELEDDRQIAIDVLGLANFLAYHGITYRQFNDALESFLDNPEQVPYPSKAQNIVYNLALAYSRSVMVADQIMEQHGLSKLDRIHTVEPAQSHSYQCKDIQGFTTARAIFAPFGRKVRRRSESQKNVMVKHGNESLEIAADIGAELHQRLCENWQRLMDRYGRPHGISFDTWNECSVEWLQDFILRSPLKSAYYQEASNYNQEYLRKVAMMAYSEEKANEPACDISRKGECSVCAE